MKPQKYENNTTSKDIFVFSEFQSIKVIDCKLNVQIGSENNNFIPVAITGNRIT